MPSHNKTFKLSVEDMHLIETALRTRVASKQDALPEGEYRNLTSRVNDLLGRLHNQKNFYRPKSGTYVSG